MHELTSALSEAARNPGPREYRELLRAAQAFGASAINHMNGPHRSKAIEASCAIIDFVDLMFPDGVENGGADVDI